MAPIYFVLIIVFIKLSIKPESLGPISYFPEHSLDGVPSFQLPDDSVFYVSPSSPAVSLMMDEVMIHLSPGIEYMLFDSKEDVEQAYRDMYVFENCVCNCLVINIIS